MFRYIEGKKVIKICLLFGLCLYFVKMRKEHGVIWKTFTRNMEKKSNVDKENLNVRYNEESHKVGITHVNEWSVWMSVMDEKYVRRRERIKEVCKHNGIKEPNVFSDGGMLVDVRNKIAACPVGKIGSSTWFKIFRNLLPQKLIRKYAKEYDEEIIRHILEAPITKIKTKTAPIGTNDYRMRRNFPYDYDLDELSTFLKKEISLSFTFVRHPFERLVSAYKDKVLRNNGTYFWASDNHWKKYTYKHYQQWYRNDHSFPSFVHLVIEEYNASQMNGHWFPIHRTCKHCHISYDVVGHLDTMSEDLRYIILKSNLQKVLKLEDVLSVHELSTQHTHDETLAYFAKLSTKDVKTLYEIYKNDFDLFNFSPKVYFDQAM